MFLSMMLSQESDVTFRWLDIVVLFKSSSVYITDFNFCERAASTHCADLAQAAMVFQNGFVGILTSAKKPTTSVVAPLAHAYAGLPITGSRNLGSALGCSMNDNLSWKFFPAGSTRKVRTCGGN